MKILKKYVRNNMFDLKKIDNDEQKILFLNTGEKLGIKPFIIEKDYWVCYILNYLFNKCQYKNFLIFKGGTSLSKAYNAIKRFSEDIDLILDYEVIDFKKEILYEDRSNNQQTKFNEEIIKISSKFLEEKLLPLMIKDLEKDLEMKLNIYMDDSDKDRCTIIFKYPSNFSNYNYIKPEIKLEIGPLADKSNASYVYITSYIEKAYPSLIKEKIKVKTIDAEKTFWEKIVILNTIANGYKDNKIPDRYSRHYYDVYSLAHTDIKKKAFMKNELLDQDVEFKSKFYYAKGAHYENININNIKLIPKDNVIKKLKSDYENMKEMFFGEYPSFEEIIEYLKKLEIEIKNLK